MSSVKMSLLIPEKRTIIPACDVGTLDQLGKIVRVTKDDPNVRAYKVGFDLGLGYGLGPVVDAIKGEYPEAILMYDHQKASTDVPHTGKGFARKMEESGVDAAILFPRERDPVTQYVWTNELLERGVAVLIGGELTHREATPDNEQIYWNGVFQGVRDFVVPGTKPERVAFYKDMMDRFGIKYSFFSPGLISQGGEITEAGEAAGERFHGIVGRAIFNPQKRDDLNDVTEEEMAESLQVLTKGLYPTE